MKAATKSFLALTMAISGGYSASATVITFDDLAHTDYVHYVNPLVSNGFKFQTSYPSGIYWLEIYSKNLPNNMDPGGAAVSMPSLSETVEITKEDGGFFDFSSIDLGDYANTGVSGTVIFNFVNSAGSTLAYVDLDALPGGQTFSFSDKTDLLSVSIAASYQVKFIQFDNVDVSASAVPAAPVPEPASWLLMIVGAGAVGTQMRHRTRVRLAH